MFIADIEKGTISLSRGTLLAGSVAIKKLNRRKKLSLSNREKGERDGRG